MPIDPVTGMLITAGVQAGTTAIGGIAKAIGAARMRSPEEKERLEELRRLREEGGLGLTEAERTALEARLTTQRAAGLRQAQTISEQARQAAGGGGRELFLAEMAAQEAEQQARTEQAAIIGQQEVAARQAQQQELAALTEREAAQRAAIAEGLSMGLITAGVAGGTALTMGQMKKQQQIGKAQSDTGADVLEDI